MPDLGSIRPGQPTPTPIAFCPVSARSFLVASAMRWMSFSAGSTALVGMEDFLSTANCSPVRMTPILTLVPPMSMPTRQSMSFLRCRDWDSILKSVCRVAWAGVLACPCCCRFGATRASEYRCPCHPSREGFNMAESKKLGAAIFGAGWVAGEHARAYQACSRTKLAAVGSRKEESARKCAEYAGVKDAFITTDFDA